MGINQVQVISSTSGISQFCIIPKGTDTSTRPFGPLMASMLQKARGTIGMPLTYIKMSDVAITIFSDNVRGLFSMILHGSEDDPELMKLISEQILLCHTEEIFRSHTPLPSESFRQQYNTLIKAILGTVKPILEEVRKAPGITAAVVCDGSIILEQVGIIDQIAFFINVQLIVSAQNLMKMFRDEARMITFKSSNLQMIQIYNIMQWSLIIVMDGSASSRSFEEPIQKTIKFLHNLLNLYQEILDASQQNNLS